MLTDFHFHCISFILVISVVANWKRNVSNVTCGVFKFVPHMFWKLPVHFEAIIKIIYASLLYICSCGLLLFHCTIG